MKKALSLILVMVLLLSALPLTVLAAEADISATGNTLLKTADVTIEDPVAGMTPDLNPQIPDDAVHGDLYEVTGVEWSGTLDDGKFIAGNTYEVEIKVSVIDSDDSFCTLIEDGSNISSPISGTINGRSVILDMDGFGDEYAPYSRTVYMRTSFFCEDCPPISSVEVTGVIAPVAGANPFYAAVVPDGAEYQRDSGKNYWYGNDYFYLGVAWYEADTGASLDSYSVLEAGKDYICKIYLMPKVNGRLFADDTTGTVNGEAAEVSVESSNRRVVLTCTFTCYSIEVEDKPIASVEVTGVAEPFAGAALNYSASVPSGKGYKVSSYTGGGFKNGVYWYNITDKKEMADGGTFERGKQYSVAVMLTPANDSYHNYYFTSNVSGTLNGIDAEIVDYGRGSIGVRRTFTCTKTQIPSVKITDVVVPVAGENPSYTADVPDGAAYQRAATTNSYYQNGFAWYDVEAGAWLTPSSVFEAGKQYFCRIYLTPVSEDYSFAGEPTGTINSEEAVVSIQTLNQRIYLTKTFTCKPPRIASVEVTDVVAPAPGAAPTYSAGVPAGENYQVEEDFTDGTWHNGVLWQNKTDNKDMIESDTFEIGKQYTVTVLLDSAADYSFASNVSGTLNGTDAEIIVYSDSSIGVYCTFTCVKAPIASVEVTDVLAPAAGAKPSYTATVPDGAAYERYALTNSYYQNGFAWYDVAAKTWLTPSSVFEAGKEYFCRIYLTPVSEDETFADEPTGAVNGEEAEVGVQTPNQRIYLTYTFTCYSYMDYAEATITAPAAGEHPSYNAVDPDDPGYEIYPLNGTYVRNGVTWFDAEGSPLDPDTAVFEAGKQYKVEITVGPNYPYKFLDADKMYAEINGNEAEAVNRPEWTRGLICTFTCPSNQSAIILGDADGDGEVTSIDATCIQRALASLAVPDSYSEAAADVDGDGEVTSIDATYIQRYLAMMNPPYAIGEPIA